MHRIFPFFAPALCLKDSVEGVVINIHTEGKILKWKGPEEAYDDNRMTSIQALEGSLRKWPEALAAVISVIKASQDIRRRDNEEKKLVRRMEKALISAQTKYPHLKDLVGKPTARQVEDHVDALAKEMLEDAHGDERFIARSKAFVQEKMKSILSKL